MTNVRDLITHVDHFQHRVVQDALADATSLYWERRAAIFEWARPRPGDYTGQATKADIARRDTDLRDAAEACRARAAIAVRRVA